MEDGPFKNSDTPAWARGVAYALAAVCAVAGIGLAFALIGALYWLGGKGFGWW